MNFLTIITRFRSYFVIFFVDAYTKMDVGKSQIGKTDDNIRESILNAKGLDFNRRNSYSDLSMLLFFIISICNIILLG